MNPQQQQLVVMLNQRGKSSWEDGNDEEALQHFNRAMTILTTNFGGGGGTGISNSDWGAFTFPLKDQGKCLPPISQHQVITEDDDKYHAMSVWQEDMMDITNSNPCFRSPTTLCATILSNMALVYSQKHDYLQMKHCLQRAFQMLLVMNTTSTTTNFGDHQPTQHQQQTVVEQDPSLRLLHEYQYQQQPQQRLRTTTTTSTTTTTTNSPESSSSSFLLAMAIQVQYNLGYCCYRMSQFEDALKHYSFPLMLPDNKNNNSNHISSSSSSVFKTNMDRAICLNCKAITYARMGQPIRAVELLSHAISLAAAAAAAAAATSNTGRGGGEGRERTTQTISLLLKNLSIICSENFHRQDHNGCAGAPVARPSAHTMGTTATTSQRVFATSTPTEPAAVHQDGTTRSLQRSGDPIVVVPTQQQAVAGGSDGSHHVNLPTNATPASAVTLLLCNTITGTGTTSNSNSISSNPTSALQALEGALQSIYNLLIQQRLQQGGGGERILEASDLVSALQSCGDTCFHLNQYHRAIQLYRDAISVHHQHYDHDHQGHQNRRMRTSTTSGLIGARLRIRLLRALSDTHQASRDYPTTMTYLRQLYDVQCNLYGTDSLVVGSTVARLAWVQYLMGNHSSALNFYEEALRVWLLIEERVGSSRDCNDMENEEKEEKPKWEDIEHVLNMMGLLHLQLKEYDNAKAAFLHCLSRVQIHQQPQSEENRAVATLQYNLATADLGRGRQEEGLAMLEQSLESDRRVLGPYHPDLIKTLQFLGELHEGLGQYEKSLQFYQQALDIGRIVLLSGPPLDGASRLTPVALQTLKKVCRLLNVMGNVHLARGDLPPMMQHLVEATRLAELMRCSSMVPVADLPVIQISGLLGYIIHRIFPPCAEAA